MRYMPIVLGTAAALMFATDVEAQDRPDFSGSWTQVQEAGGAPPAGGRGGGRGGGFGGLGMTATIAQTATTLTITRSFGETQFVATYNLDGSESTNTMMGGRGGGGMPQVSTAAWDGAKLVITTTSEGRGGQTQTTMALSLNAGGNLVVETTRPGRGGGAATTTSTTYTKG